MDIDIQNILFGLICEPARTSSTHLRWGGEKQTWKYLWSSLGCANLKQQWKQKPQDKSKTELFHFQTEHIECVKAFGRELQLRWINNGGVMIIILFYCVVFRFSFMYLMFYWIFPIVLSLRNLVQGRCPCPWTFRWALRSFQPKQFCHSVILIIYTRDWVMVPRINDTTGWYPPWLGAGIFLRPILRFLYKGNWPGSVQTETWDCINKQAVKNSWELKLWCQREWTTSSWQN